MSVRLFVFVCVCVCLAHSARAFCNFSAPLDAAWMADAFARCGQIAECDRIYGVTRGLTAASFEQFVAQAGITNTTGPLDEYVCSRAPRDAAIETFVLRMIVRPPLDTCPPQQEYRPATRTCGFALDVVPVDVQLTAIVEPVLLGAVVLLLAVIAVVLLVRPPRASGYPNK
jgi:hypothetical protein